LQETKDSSSQEVLISSTFIIHIVYLLEGTAAPVCQEPDTCTGIKAGTWATAWGRESLWD
jgi:hypothetical protein